MNLRSKVTSSHLTDRNSSRNFLNQQETSSSLWNPNVHRRHHKSSPSNPILSELNPVHSLTIHFTMIDFNFTLSSIHRPTKRILRDFQPKFCTDFLFVSMFLQSS